MHAIKCADLSIAHLWNRVAGTEGYSQSPLAPLATWIGVLPLIFATRGTEEAMHKQSRATSKKLFDEKTIRSTEPNAERFSNERQLHRLGIVRRQQGISQRTVAQYLNKRLHQVQDQEQETFDLNLSDLYLWQAILDVPIADLLTDPSTQLSRPVLERARLVRLMKTLASILERSHVSGIRCLAQTMIDQLIEIMPELAGIGPWPAVGKPRGVDEYGVVFDRRISEDLVRLISRVGDASGIN